MAAQLGIKIISGASDGAAAELAAQNMMDNLPSEKEQIVYENMEHGYRIKVAVHETGPFFANQDPEHRRKTGRNQPQQALGRASLSIAVLWIYANHQIQGCTMLMLSM